MPRRARCHSQHTPALAAGRHGDCTATRLRCPRRSVALLLLHQRQVQLAGKRLCRWQVDLLRCCLVRLWRLAGSLQAG